MSDPFQQSVDALQAEDGHASLQQPEADQATAQEQHAASDQDPVDSQAAAVQLASLAMGSNTPAAEESVSSEEKAAMHAAASVSSSSGVAVLAGTDATSPSPVGSASTDAWEMVQVTTSVCLVIFMRAMLRAVMH